VSRILFSIVCLASLLGPTVSLAALGASRLLPALYAPGVSEVMDAEAVTVDAEQGVEGLSILMVSAGSTLQGRIIDNQERPLVGVWVVAEMETFQIFGLTDSEGRFSLEGLPSQASVFLRASTDDPNSREQRYAARYYPDGLSREGAAAFSFDGDGSSDVVPDWILELGSTLRGEIRTDDGAGPLVDTEVVLHRDSDGGTWQRRSDAKGRFVFRGLSAGSYRVGAVPVPGESYLPGWSGGARSVTKAGSLSLEAGGETPVVLTVDRGASIRGQLRSDGPNTPLPDLEVQAISHLTTEVYSTTSDEFGFYEIFGLSARGGDSYIVYCPSLNRYYPDAPREEDARRVTVVEGETTSRVDIRGTDPRDCALTSEFSGVIEGGLSLDFADLESAHLLVISETDTIARELVEGRAYTADCFPSGEYKIGLFTQGPFVTQYYDLTENIDFAEVVTVDPDSATGINFQPLEASWIAGTVRETGGNPVSEASITILDETLEAVAGGRTDLQGVFRIDRIFDGSGLPAGQYYVRAESTVVADPEVTPVLQPTIVLDVVAGEAHIRWSLAGSWWWELALYRIDEVTGFSERLWHESAGPEGPLDWIDRPGTGRYRYRLEARAFSSEGVAESPWIEVWSEVVDVAAPSLSAVWPNPWNGSGVVTFRDQNGASIRTEDTVLEIISAVGRRIRDLTWNKEVGQLAWDGTDARGRGVASGIYFARRRAKGGDILSRALIVVQR